MSESATKGFLTNAKYLSRPQEKCLMTPMGVATFRLKITGYTHSEFAAIALVLIILSYERVLFTTPQWQL